MVKGRLEAFSDGVIAIIITIMVLELKIPHESDLDALRPLIPTFLGVEFRACWYLLEQSPSSVSGSPTSEWFNFVGKPTFVVLVIIISLCHRMDG